MSHTKTIIKGITDILNEVGNDIERECPSRGKCVDCEYHTINGCAVILLENIVDGLIKNIGYDPLENSDELRKVLFKEN